MMTTWLAGATAGVPASTTSNSRALELLPCCSGMRHAGRNSSCHAASNGVPGSEGTPGSKGTVGGKRTVGSRGTVGSKGTPLALRHAGLERTSAASLMLNPSVAPAPAGEKKGYKQQYRTRQRRIRRALAARTYSQAGGGASFGSQTQRSWDLNSRLPEPRPILGYTGPDGLNP